jgi:hypothetical protein
MNVKYFLWPDLSGVMWERSEGKLEPRIFTLDTLITSISLGNTSMTSVHWETNLDYIEIQWCKPYTLQVSDSGSRLMQQIKYRGLGWVMVLTTTFKNMSAISWRSVISWWSVLLMEETTNLPQVTDKHFVYIGFWFIS